MDLNDLQEIFGEKANELDGDVEMVLGMLDAIANHDMRLIFDSETGEMLPPPKWPDREAMAVRRITQSEKNGKPMWQVDWYDRAGALQMMSKMKSLFDAPEINYNPLEEALMRIPRDELTLMKKALDGLAEAAEREIAA